MLTGNLLRKIKANRAVSGALSFAGAVVGIFRRSVTKAGTLTLSGAYSYVVTLSQRLYTAAGTLTTSGALSWKVNYKRAVAGALSFAGAVTYIAGNSFKAAGTLTISGAVAGIRAFVQRSYTAAGTLSMSGSLIYAQGSSATRAGVLSFAGALTYVAQPIVNRYYFGVENTGVTYFGGQNTDGSWRFIPSSNDLNVERRESGVWTKKGNHRPS